MIHVGFVGTRRGMRPDQRSAVYLLLRGLYRDAGITLHHGDGIGADAEFHELARKVFGPDSWIVGHPSTHNLRAFCEFDEERDRLPPLERNRVIAEAADIVLAAPYEMTEQERDDTWHDDTWNTIRIARELARELVIVYPDGSVKEEKGNQ